MVKNGCFYFHSFLAFFYAFLSFSSAFGSIGNDGSILPSSLSFVYGLKPKSSSNRSLITDETFASYTNFSYYMRFNGPALGRTFQETYNPYTNSVWPVQMFHSIGATHHFGGNYSFGAEVSGVQDVAYGVENEFGEISPQMSVFDPSVSLQRSSVYSNSWMHLGLGLTYFIPVTEFSRQQEKIGSLAFDQTWNYKPQNKLWNFNISTRLQPSFYREIPLGARTFFASVGHQLGYNFTDYFEIVNSSLFDLSQSGGKKDVFDFENASLDRTQVQMNFYSPKKILRFGAYVQALIFDARLETTTVGIDLTLALNLGRGAR